MNSLPVEYFAIQDSNGNIDFDSFRSFVDNHVRTWRDVEYMSTIELGRIIKGL